MDFYQELIAIFGTDHVACDESMAEHTTFRLGGPADYFVTPSEPQALAQGIALCRQAGVPYYIIGNGSNLLVGDQGFRGVIFHISRGMDSITCTEQEDRLILVAGAGALLARAARLVSDKGFAGFEYATGIPGSIGGAVMMDAGAYGGEIKDSLQWADVLDAETGETKRLLTEELRFGYRHSIIMEKDFIVLQACFAFERGDAEEIARLTAELSDKRKANQPLDYPSAGSTFKRPTGYFAGKLIQDSGLKGFKVGGAQVSEKHAGFVINTGNATAADVRELIRQVQDRVYEKFEVRLETEVRFIGDF